MRPSIFIWAAFAIAGLAAETVFGQDPESAQEAYLLADRENVNDRFMGFEKRLLGGVRWEFWRHADLEMTAGYAFDRYYGVGQNQIGNLQDEVNIAPGAYISAAFHVRF